MDKKITVREATLRSNNMHWIAYMAITAAAVVERLIGADNLVDRMDEAVIILLAIAGLVWYFSQRNRYQHSFTPRVLFIATFVVQATSLTACSAAPKIVELGLPAATATPQQPAPTAAIPVVNASAPGSVLTGSSTAIAFKPANEVEGLTHCELDRSRLEHFRS